VAHPRTLALDVGDKRIGIALTDELGLTAQPLFTLHRESGKSGLRADVKAVSRFIRQHKVAIVVVGNPLHADGSPSPQSAKALAFAAELRAAHPTLEHHLLDERLTTREAHALLDEAGHLARSTGHAARIERQHLIDQVAAVLILESYLLKDGPALLPDPDALPERL
jgi:putative Holliday junction resolvase